MTTPTLHDRLADLSTDAPPGGPVPGLWETGVRRHRRRRAGVLGAVAAAVALVVGVGLALGLDAGSERSLPPTGVPFDDLHLPRTVYPPSRWAEGTDDAGPPGPLAALSMAARDLPTGWTGVRRTSAPFGVSAVDGSVRFLDLPGTDLAKLGVGWLALSPDGRKVGYARIRHGDLVGWAVYDTTTGATVRLSDPANPVIRGTDVFEIEFSGDSRYLETNYSPSGSDGSRDDQLVVWDARTGQPTPAEGTGYYWLPDMGSAPHGIVWSRGDRTFTFDPSSGRTTSERFPHELVETSYGPQDRATAYVAFGEHKRDPWRLYVDGRPADLDVEPGAVLGWRDAHTVVVANLTGTRARLVDVRTGAAEDPSLDSSRDAGLEMGPLYAADLWANPLVDGVRPPHAGDGRIGPREVAGGAAAVVALAALVGWILWRRRARA